MFQRAAAVAAGVAVLLVAGSCAQQDVGGPSAGASDAPETFVVDEAAVSFELPAGWDEFDSKTMQDALEDSAALDEVSDRSGMSSDQMQQLLASNVSLYVVAPRGEDGVLGNVNVMVFDHEKLPTAGALKLQYRTLGAADIESDDVSTEVGDGFATTYQLELQGRSMYGESLALDVNGSAMLLTITSGAADRTDELARQVLESLATV